MGHAPERRPLSAVVAAEESARLEELAEAVWRLASTAPSGRLALAAAAEAIDPAWLPGPEGARIAAELDRAAASARTPLPVDAVERVLAEAWGERLLDALDPEPVAVTAAAQVHRGIHDGAPVAVKVLRPGLAAGVRQDLTLLEAIAAPLAGAFPALDAGAVLAEVRERVLDELDLEHEAMVQRRFHRALRRHPYLHVPAPITALCHEQVLVSAWVDGVALPEAPDPDAAGARLLEFALGAARWGLAYADMTPANVIVTADGGLAIVDFGACREVDRDRLAATADALEGLMAADETAFTAAVERLGWLPAGPAASAFALLREGLGELIEPGRRRLDTAAVIAVRDRFAARGETVARVLGAGRLAPEDLWPARGAGQVLGTIARLGADGEWAAQALRILREGWTSNP